MRAALMFFGGGGIGTTLDPANKDLDAVLSNQNQTLTGGFQGAGAGIAATFSGGQKFYFEARINAVGSTSRRSMIGVQWSSILWSTSFGTETEVGIASLSVGFDAHNGNIWINGSTTSTMGGVTFAAGDVMNVAVDTSGSGKIWVGKNGTWLLSGNPVAGTNSVTTLPNTSVRPALSVQDNLASTTLLAGPTLQYAPPSGFPSI